MNLTFLDRKRERPAEATCIVEEHGNTLRLVEESRATTCARRWEPRIIRGRDEVNPESSTGGSVTARAEIHAKRFSGNRVNEDRYAASIVAADGSPNALLAALSRAFSEVDELRASHGPDERLILQVSLIV